MVHIAAVARLSTISFALLAFSTTSLGVPYEQPRLRLYTAQQKLEPGLANVHLDWTTITGTATRHFALTFGPCNDKHEEHKDIVSQNIIEDALPKRAVWIVNEEDAGRAGCVFAWLDRGLAARSEPIDIVASKRSLTKRQEKMESFDTTGLWFDGVKQVENVTALTKADKTVKIAIIGAGMSGLMTSFLLDSVGLHNYTIIEAAQRLGGRVHTEYFADKDEYQYQEMGPMRFPYSITDSITNETVKIRDSQLVFQLAAELNKVNAGNDNRTVNFIPWYQSAPGNLVYKNGFKTAKGLPPNNAEVKANASLLPSVPASQDMKAAQASVANLTSTHDLTRKLVENIFRAHHDWIAAGYDDFSEFGYLHDKLNYSLDVTDSITGGPAGAATSLWDAYYEDTWFSNATSWRTIDKGLSQLPNAFWGTAAGKRVRMNQKVYKVDNEQDGRVRVHWRTNSSASFVESPSETFDYAFVSAPFSVVKYWRVPNVSERMHRAIQNLKYSNACKVAMQFKSRFWERKDLFDPPIQGGCSNTDLPGIRNICYPSYKIGAKGQGVLLAQYVSGDDGDRLVSWPEDFHVQYVLDALAEMHGKVVYDEYEKGIRRCWGLDEYQGAAWASPVAGQHKLYIPEYYKIHNRTIFVGEHTSFTHAWISSALESAIRGTAQLLLELGLVDEAKQVTNKWMGRWMSV